MSLFSGVFGLVCSGRLVANRRENLYFSNFHGHRCLEHKYDKGVFLQIENPTNNNLIVRYGMVGWSIHLPHLNIWMVFWTQGESTGYAFNSTMNGACFESMSGQPCIFNLISIHFHFTFKTLFHLYNILNQGPIETIALHWPYWSWNQERIGRNILSLFHLKLPMEGAKALLAIKWNGPGGRAWVPLELIQKLTSKNLFRHHIWWKYQAIWSTAKLW